LIHHHHDHKNCTKIDINQITSVLVMRPIALPLCLLLVLFTKQAFSGEAFSGEYVIGHPNSGSALNECRIIMEQVYEAIGLPVTFKGFPARRSLAFLSAGKIDADLCRIADTYEHYPNLIRLEPALTEIEFSALSKNTIEPVRTIKDVQGKRIGTIRGMLAAEMVFTGNNVHFESSWRSVGQLLVDDLVDIIILPTSSIKKLMKDVRFPQNYRQAPTLYKFAMFHYVHKKHVKLVPELTAEIKKRSKLTSLTNLNL